MGARTWEGVDRAMGTFRSHLPLKGLEEVIAAAVGAAAAVALHAQGQEHTSPKVLLAHLAGRGERRNACTRR